MTTADFFDESTSQSIVKASIVSKYFAAWARIIVPQAKKRGLDKVGYIDLFAGTGYYEDGTQSTPIKVLKRATRDSDLRQMLVSFFNDKDSENARKLSKSISELPEVHRLKYQPRVESIEVGEGLIESLKDIKLIPSLIFIDPWGYKGISLNLLTSFVKNWGCDCFFFFNFNRVNAAIDNPKVSSHVDALFGEVRAEQLREKLKPLNSHERKLAIIEEISEALTESVGQYVLPFGFKNDRGTRTSHYLIFVSKHPLGYHLAKDIMSSESSELTQGVPSFEYCPATERQPLLFEYSRPLDDLAEMLLSEFAGKELTMKEIYEKHNIGKPFLERNYKDVLRKLEEQKKITTSPAASQRPKRKGVVTFSDKVRVIFPVKP